MIDYSKHTVTLYDPVTGQPVQVPVSALGLGAIITPAPQPEPEKPAHEAKGPEITLTRVGRTLFLRSHEQLTVTLRDEDGEMLQNRPSTSYIGHGKVLGRDLSWLVITDNPSGKDTVGFEIEAGNHTYYAALSIDSDVSQEQFLDLYPTLSQAVDDANRPRVAGIGDIFVTKRP